MPKAKNDSSDVIINDAPAPHPPGPLAGSKSELAGVSDLVERLLPQQVMIFGRCAAAQATSKVKQSDPDIYYGRLKVAFCCFAHELAEAGKL